LFKNKVHKYLQNLIKTSLYQWNHWWDR